LARLAGLLPKRRDTHDAKHLPTLLEGLEMKRSLETYCFGKHSGHPLIYLNTEPSLVGDDAAENHQQRSEQ
jgi:hypothetical protein